MAVNLRSVVLHVRDIGRAAAFWGEALGYQAEPGNPAYLAAPDGRGPRLHLDEDDGTHLDLWVDRQGSDLETEVARFVALGATRVEWDYPPDADFVVLADPEGNLFCVVA